jgi:hypothetical protein
MKPVVIASLLGLASYTSVAQPQFGNTITIDAPVYHDLYLAGATVIINATVHGDLVVAGGTITINDTVTNDIILTGGTVTFNGYVGDDIRCAGGKLTLMQPVAGDVVAAGGTIVIKKGVSVGNVMAGGTDITIDGTVTGTLRCASGNLVFNGQAMKEVDCRGGHITINGWIRGESVLAASEELLIGNTAGFSGHVRYWAPGRQVDFKQSLRGAEATYDPTLRLNGNRWYLLGFSSVIGLLWYAGMVLIFIMVIQYLFAHTMKKAGETAYSRALRSFGYGILFWLGIPVAAAIVFVTVIGLPVALLLLFLYIILALLATIISAVVAANWLNNRSNTNWHYWRLVFTAFGIFIVLKVLTFTPFLGWVLAAILVCISFGAIVLNINWLKRKRAAVD